MRDNFFAKKQNMGMTTKSMEFVAPDRKEQEYFIQEELFRERICNAQINHFFVVEQ